MTDEKYQLAHADDHPLAAAIRKAIGVRSDEIVPIMFPQFYRTDGKLIKDFPTGADYLDGLKKAPKWLLKDLGLQPWDEESGLWLFPHEWYDHIPEGYEILSISGKRERFKPGVTDNDIRFGALAYGIVNKAAMPAPKTGT